jgi:hypothetical protein
VGGRTSKALSERKRNYATDKKRRTGARNINKGGEGTRVGRVRSLFATTCARKDMGNRGKEKGQGEGAAYGGRRALINKRINLLKKLQERRTSHSRCTIVWWTQSAKLKINGPHMQGIIRKTLERITNASGKIIGAGG